MEASATIRDAPWKAAGSSWTCPSAPCAVAGVALREVEDWNCCGASTAHGLNHDLAVALPYRVLALAEAQGRAEILAPCAACFSRLKGTLVRLRRNPELLEKMAALTGRPCKVRGGGQRPGIPESSSEGRPGGQAHRAAPRRESRPVLWVPAQPRRGHRRGRRRREPDGDGSRDPRRRVRSRSLELCHGVLRRRVQPGQDRSGGGPGRGDPRRRRGRRRADDRDRLPDVPQQPGHAAARDQRRRPPAARCRSCT